MVMTSGTPGRTRGRIRIGTADPSLTAAGGMLAVTELCGRLGLIEALDAGIGPVKQRRRGFSGGQVLTGMAAAQLAGEDFLVGLDRLRADEAGQHLVPVPGLATSTATGLARRFTARHWRGAEAGLAAATARMAGLLPPERAAELAGGPTPRPRANSGPTHSWPRETPTRALIDPPADLHACHRPGLAANQEPDRRPGKPGTSPAQEPHREQRPAATRTLPRRPPRRLRT
jgi:hypothetical protein